MRHVRLLTRTVNGNHGPTGQSVSGACSLSLRERYLRRWVETSLRALGVRELHTDEG
jgi:hypothetical protein